MKRYSHRLRRVTHVDDEPDIRAITELACTTIGGFELDSCASGEEALERIPRFRPDLILLDVMMPGMDGIETFRRLRMIGKVADTPIVFLTARIANGDADTYMKLGAADVIGKPFDPLKLPEQITEIWKRCCVR